MVTPDIGSIVKYTDEQQQVRAAIVIDIENNELLLYVITNANSAGIKVKYNARTYVVYVPILETSLLPGTTGAIGKWSPA